MSSTIPSWNSWNSCRKTAAPASFTKSWRKSASTVSYLGWQLGVGALGVVCLIAVGWIIKLIFWPGGDGTVTIILDKPDLTVYIDGELLPEGDYEKPLDRYKPGEHKLESSPGPASGQQADLHGGS